MHTGMDPGGVKGVGDEAVVRQGVRELFGTMGENSEPAVWMLRKAIACGTCRRSPTKGVTYVVVTLHIRPSWFECKSMLWRRYAHGEISNKEITSPNR